ncbi:MAG: phosphatase PAP2 family protein [Ignavibacteriaceae bacterium]|nr:phosphatase PAP2 family protein [Ignavibacteriaceae bacterium]
MSFKERLFKIKSVISDYSSREIKILINLFVFVTAILVFTLLAKEVVQGDTQKLDELILNSLRNKDSIKVPIGPAWLTGLMTDITALGGATIIFLITATVFFYLLIQKKYEFMWLIFTATIGGALLSFGLKELFARERPPLVFHLLTVKSMSFPSGHAMISSIVYLTQGALLAKVQSNKNLRIYILLVAIILVFLIGISRVYLGVHYPTDVLAGWSIGLAWASLCWLMAKYLQRKKESKAN